MLPKNLTFVDVETTGLRASFDRIIEIGVLRVEENKLVQTYSSLVDPGFSLQPEITFLTGITSNDLENAPSFRQIQDNLISLFEDSVMVAHNVRFDYSFLKNEFKRLGVNFSPKQLCSVKLSRQLYPKFRRHDLSSIIERFNFDCQNRHRAFDDAKVIWDFYQKIQQEFEKEKLEKAINFVFKRPSLPVNLPIKTLDSLPDGPGVYIFYGDNGSILYVGKSINIRTRVLSHFSSDYASSTEMKISQQIKSIETIETAGELGALLKESYLIKKLQPIYNRMQRLSSKLIVAQRQTNPEGFEVVKLETLNNIPVENLHKILGVFKNQKAAKNFLIDLCKTHSLCEKLLGLEKAKGACFGFRLGRCKGACLGKEMVARYNLRFFEAFANHQIKPWPFEGAIIIKEKDLLEEKEEGFLINNWCFLGKINSEDTIEEEYSFDLDTYKILARYILNPANRVNIKLISPDKLKSFRYQFTV